MNDSLSVSSSYSSSNNSNSNSLNRSLLSNGSFLTSSSASSASSSTSSTSKSITTTTTTNSHSNTSTNIINNTTDNLLLNGTNSAVAYLATKCVDDFFLIRMNTNRQRRRKAKSQILFEGDDAITLSEQNKQLIEDLYLLKKLLKEKEDTIYKLNDIRDRLESEIQELSASLFEQAYAMVNTAKAETAQAEKLLKEANGKIDVLQAEVKALKELVITSTPSTPNKHLYPQLNSNQQQQKSHSRQSSLNQQHLNNLNRNLINSNNNNNNNSSCNPLVTLPSATSTPSSSTNSSSSTHNSNLSHLNSLNHQLNSKSLNQIDKKIQIVYSSTSTQPIASSNTSNVKESSSFFKTHHKRMPSHSDIHQSQQQPQQHSQPKSFIDKLFQSSSSSLNLSSSSSNKQQFVVNNNYLSITNQENYFDTNRVVYEIAEFNPIYFKEIVEWKETPDLKPNSDFMRRAFQEDILLCLDFPDKKLSNDLLNAIESNSVCIEDLTNCNISFEELAQTCGLSNITSVCQYKIKINENSSWIYISKLSRNRVIAVCDFFTYLRYIKDGLVKCDNVTEPTWFLTEQIEISCRWCIWYVIHKNLLRE